jgi:arabinan endo-1,5-alpha-L-arabinosidase
MTGDLSPVHDPCIIKQGATYHLFCTSQANQKPGLIHWRTSPDLVTWTLVGAVMPALPDWAQKEVPGTRGAWAPGHQPDQRPLSPLLRALDLREEPLGDRPADHRDPGPVRSGLRLARRGRGAGLEIQRRLQRHRPNIVATADGRVWMSFGSFWSGLKLVEIDPATGKPKPGAR